MTKPITIHVKDDDQDVRDWLEKRRTQLLKDFGIRTSLSMVAMGELRKAMEGEHAKSRKTGKR
ncbi:MAG: hypothetical protein ACOC6C_03410 [Verrucomicrobiota bacterium]